MELLDTSDWLQAEASGTIKAQQEYFSRAPEPQESRGEIKARAPQDEDTKS